MSLLFILLCRLSNIKFSTLEDVSECDIGVFFDALHKFRSFLLPVVFDYGPALPIWIKTLSNTTVQKLEFRYELITATRQIFKVWKQSLILIVDWTVSGISRPTYLLYNVIGFYFLLPLTRVLCMTESLTSTVRYKMKAMGEIPSGY